MRRAFVVLVIGALALGGQLPALACRTPRLADDGRYVGGDLATQVARKADTIRIVRAVRRHLVSRTYDEGLHFLRFGEPPPSPSPRPEYTDTFAVEFEVVETLKRHGSEGNEFYEKALRTTAYGATEFVAHQRALDPSVSLNAADFGRSLPEYLLDRPGHDRYPYAGGAVPAGQESSCRRPYHIDLGQTFVALGDPNGRFYLTDSDGAVLLTGLRIDVEYRREDARRYERSHFNMQPLVLIQSESDPFLVRLRQALAALASPTSQ